MFFSSTQGITIAMAFCLLFTSASAAQKKPDKQAVAKQKAIAYLCTQPELLETLQKKLGDRKMPAGLEKLAELREEDAEAHLKKLAKYCWEICGTNAALHETKRLASPLLSGVIGVIGVTSLKHGVADIDPKFLILGALVSGFAVWRGYDIYQGSQLTSTQHKMLSEISGAVTQFPVIAKLVKDNPILLKALPEYGDPLLEFVVQNDTRAKQLAEILEDDAFKEATTSIFSVRGRTMAAFALLIKTREELNVATQCITTLQEIVDAAQALNDTLQESN